MHPRASVTNPVEPLALSIVIPGEPVGQGRPRAASTGGGRIRMYTDAKSRSWRGAAQVHMTVAMTEAGLKAPAFGQELVEVEVLAVFACPRSHWKKREPLKRRPYRGRRDCDNLLKAALDAGNGILWFDDAQVWRAQIARIYGEQGEAPHVAVRVWTFRPNMLTLANPWAPEP